MGAQLHQALRTLCFNTDWMYAVFWKLKHRARMTLTWEDAYYDNCEQHDPPDNMGGNLCDRRSHDLLGLAVAKMSYHVYSLGEGVIGQVAVTGKHTWIFADKHVNDSCSPFEHCDGLEAQFSAGIRTVLVVAVVPHGVVQLGSFNKICEDLKMVNRIRDAFIALQDSSVGREIHCTMSNSSCLSDIFTRNSGSVNFLDCFGRPVTKDKNIFCTPTFPSISKHADLPEKTAEAINKDGGLELSASGGDESALLLQSRTELFLLEQQKRVQTRLHSDRRREGESSGLGYLGVDFVDGDTPSSNNSFNEVNLYNVTIPSDDSGMDATSLQADLLDSVACNNQNMMMCALEPYGMQIQRDLEKNMEFQTEINKIEPLDMPFKFYADCELYEVLGPAFQKHSCYCDRKAEKTETETAIEMPDGMDCSSLLSAASGSEHLLEAVVANVCYGGTDVKSEKSYCDSVKSLLTAEEMKNPTCDKVTLGSSGYSFDQSLVENESLHCLSSEACGLSSSKGFSSRSRSTFSGRLDSGQEPAKLNKKRARPGESCRPRPRDRQLIQDRIKELRELVPNGSKCSIDSLLERTIKHMLFMQSIAKHAEKLNKCTQSKLLDKETVVRGLPSYDQGSTWAVEVGSHLKVCPIIIENINMNGQMLIEMLCEDCSHFLEIAEAIRSLGLTILKGVTEASGKKTLICFVVEVQNNRSMHRMDILWSLVQMLQSKATI
ncbi:Transcription factor like [Actinidia chinensis var. chinensis]|uniref:Transcription factor like n=1 Tax=Actinidia chinensis var. chinensis TaxID=1590841 RepID=A0A2R6QJ64_ACTCC|nr:Transcription factor like [Actinidia chinensis var. chinensis]